jgi:hypothetical protein
MIPMPTYYYVENGDAGGNKWFTLRELEALGSWDYCNDQSPAAGFAKVTAYSALAAVGSYGGYARPSNGLPIVVREINMTALLAEMGNVGPTPNDGANS